MMEWLHNMVNWLDNMIDVVMYFQDRDQDMLLFEKLNSRGCYKSRHVTKRDLKPFTTIQDLK